MVATRKRPILIALDGSVAPGVDAAGWGIAAQPWCEECFGNVEGQNPDRCVCSNIVRIKGMVDGADQTSWAGELWAVLRLTMALRDVGSCQTQIVVAIDCKSVAEFFYALVHDEIFNTGRGVALPQWGYGVWNDIRDGLHRSGMAARLTVEWMPSHDKLASWSPRDAPASSRYLNSMRILLE